MAKIQRNDPCPCGSGKKYKFCCGISKTNYSNINPNDLDRTDLHLVDFVLEKLGEDTNFLLNAVQMILGPSGKEFCDRYSDVIRKEYQKDLLESFVEQDIVGVFSETRNFDKKLLYHSDPYDETNPDIQYDILRMLKEGMLNVYGLQVELFHAYLMGNLIRRFDDYFYFPSDSVIRLGQGYGAFLHQGYDYLFAITLLLELQLGVHIYLNIMHPDYRDIVLNNEYFDRRNILNKEFPYNETIVFIHQYYLVLERLKKRYDPRREIALYNSAKILTEEQCRIVSRILEPSYYTNPNLKYDYFRYLGKLLVSIISNDEVAFKEANYSFPQCGFLKYRNAMRAIVELFESETDRTEAETKELYHNAVFWFFDETNGASYHERPPFLQYNDFPTVHDHEDFMKDDLYQNNPARKDTRAVPFRHLRREIYENFNGKCCKLYYRFTDDQNAEWKLISKLPFLPWFSSGKENTVHSKPYDGKAKRKNLILGNLQERQESLELEYRLTSIPINCVAEFLNPDVFYNWNQKNVLLKLTKKQNLELQETNERLKRHIQLNQQLVRNVSHSSANYLNADRLAVTGIQLHKADGSNPTLEELHNDGISLLFQSEQEMFLLRQLKGLVLRCNGDQDSMTRLIRESVAKEDGVSAIFPVEYALKTVLARVLLRDEDRKGGFARLKLQKKGKDLLLLKSTFMLDILAEKYSEKRLIEWWNNSIGELQFSISDTWTKLRLQEGKALCDLIVEVVVEQLLNAMIHGDVCNSISIELGQSEEVKGRPRWLYILCKNAIGEKYLGGTEKGISSLNETILMINNNKRGIEVSVDGDTYESRVWLLASLARAL